MGARRKVLYVSPDGGHKHHVEDYNSTSTSHHQHVNIEREIQLLIDQIAVLIEVTKTLDEQNAVLHARIDDLEALIPE